jgi:hypothetical protein
MQIRVFRQIFGEKRQKTVDILHLKKRRFLPIFTLFQTWGVFSFMIQISSKFVRMKLRPN